MQPIKSLDDRSFCVKTSYMDRGPRPRLSSVSRRCGRPLRGLSTAANVGNVRICWTCLTVQVISHSQYLFLLVLPPLLLLLLLLLFLLHAPTLSKSLFRPLLRIVMATQEVCGQDLTGQLAQAGHPARSNPATKTL